MKSAKSEQLRLIDEMKTKYPVSFLDCDYDYDEFLNIAKDMKLARRAVSVALGATA